MTNTKTLAITNGLFVEMTHFTPTSNGVFIECYSNKTCDSPVVMTYSELVTKDAANKMWNHLKRVNHTVVCTVEISKLHGVVMAEEVLSPTVSTRKQ